MRLQCGGALGPFVSLLLCAALVACAQAQQSENAAEPEKVSPPAGPIFAQSPPPPGRPGVSLDGELRQRLKRLYAAQADAPPAAVDEALQVKEQLGGSVLRGTFLEPPAAPNPRISSPSPLASSPSASSPSPPAPAAHAALLRDTAEQLDRLANRLERARLYARADALRGQATDLRHAARALQPADVPAGP